MNLAGAQPAVFMIDEDEMGRMSVRAVAKSIGLECVAFSSAEEFLNECDTSRTGCVVVNSMLPGMSGLELQELLEGNGFYLPVIVMSVYADLPMAV